jgi:glycosyltransferase involved in cell wall biosynthesis
MVMFSIIIPVKSINDYVRETVPHIQRLAAPEWELIVIPNEEEPNEWAGDDRVRVFPSGRVGPAAKRDMGAAQARGEILVFLDDDSYPAEDLLAIAERYFVDLSIVALGGPAITPLDDRFWQRVSGAVFLSKFSGGAPERYVSLGKARPVQDWPSVNLMVRKSDFLAIGGFDSPYWPGEDTKLCLDLMQKTGKTIMYVPEMRVWHHRRAGLGAHLRQVGAYGLHRGYFAKKHPQTSCKPIYFAPSVFLVFSVATVTVPFIQIESSQNFAIGWSIYALALFFAWIDIRKYECGLVTVAAMVYTPLTHLVYGFRFIQGIFTINLVSKLR